MSDTPLADALKDHYCLSHLDWYNLCVDLERENAALRADKARLDWLDEKGCWLTIPGQANFISGVSRSVIDAAMQEAKQ